MREVRSSLASVRPLRYTVAMKAGRKNPPPWWNDYQLRVSDDELVLGHLGDDDSLWVHGFGGGLPGVVLLRLAVADGRLACTGLFVGLDVGDRTNHLPGLPEVASGASTAIGANDLRAVPLGALLGAIEQDMGSVAFPEAWREMFHRAKRVAGTPTPRPGGLRDDELLAFAEDYGAMRAASRTSPVPDLAAKYARDEATIYRWIKKAEKKGYSPPRQQPRAKPSATKKRTNR